MRALAVMSTAMPPFTKFVGAALAALAVVGARVAAETTVPCGSSFWTLLVEFVWTIPLPSFLCAPARLHSTGVRVRPHPWPAAPPARAPATTRR